MSGQEGFVEQVQWLIDANLIPPPPVEDTVMIPEADFYWDGSAWTTRVRSEFGGDHALSIGVEGELGEEKPPGEEVKEPVTPAKPGLEIAGMNIPWEVVLIGALVVMAYMAQKRRST